MTEDIDRRDFIKKSAVAGVGLSMAPRLSPAYGRAAPVDTVVVGVMGVNSRGNALAEAFARTSGARVAYICDVDERAVRETIANLTEPQEGQPPLQEKAPEGVEDFRRILGDAAVDALAIATPDHWHTPAALTALDAGKHVYVEKPCSHNPEEGEWLVEAQHKHPDRVVQMGTQQRSAPRSIEVIQAIHEGLIGDAYYARAWYSNDRGPLHLKSPADVPSWLNYELWQGPAPRRPYPENLIHYNWHWRWHWGTGEICNNGTHEIDVCRWALEVDYPTGVSSSGGRFHFDDDWQTFDTQVASFEFEGEKAIAWEGRSCNPTPLRGTTGLPGSGGRGAAIHGTEGTAVVDRSGYVVYDMDNEVVKKSVRGGEASGTNTVGAGTLTDRHVQNFAAAVRGTEELNAPITEGRKTVLLCNLGNIAERTGHSLEVDPETGRIVGDQEATELWSRDYEPGWAPQV